MHRPQVKYQNVQQIPHTQKSLKVHDRFLQSKFRTDPKLNKTVITMFGECTSVTDAVMLRECLILAFDDAVCTVITD